MLSTSTPKPSIGPGHHAFPISETDDRSLLNDEKESITPLSANAADATCSFYIASAVIAEPATTSIVPAFGGHLSADIRPSGRMADTGPFA